MCELFAMSARHPTDVNHSLELFQPRGGETGPHADGWGVAYFAGRAAALFKECAPAAGSRCFSVLAERRLASTQVIAHIRRANPPEFGLAWANTHPFEREVRGRSWVFAHNGKLPGIHKDHRFALNRFFPLGDTDSEYAFCYLLDRIIDVGADRVDDAQPARLLPSLRDAVRSLSSLGEFNFLLGNGRFLVVHAHTRLSLLQRVCTEQGCAQRVSLIATQPLTDELWKPLLPGTLHVFADGDRVAGPESVSPNGLLMGDLEEASTDSFAF